MLFLLTGASFISGRHSGQIPVVAPEPGPIRVKPENPGGMKIDATASDVFLGSSDTAHARLAPVAEAPDPMALKAAEAASMPTVPVHRVAPASAAASPAARTAEVASAMPPKDGTAEAAGTVPAPLRAVAGEARTEAKARVDPRTAVQLAALGSESEARAESERLRGRFHALLDGRPLTVSRAEFRGRAWWRVRTGGFADAAQAHAFCDHLHARGGGCSVVAP